VISIKWSISEPGGGDWATSVSCLAAYAFPLICIFTSYIYFCIFISVYLFLYIYHCERHPSEPTDHQILAAMTVPHHYLLRSYDWT